MNKRLLSLAVADLALPPDRLPEPIQRTCLSPRPPPPFRRHGRRGGLLEPGGGELPRSGPVPARTAIPSPPHTLSGEFIVSGGGASVSGATATITQEGTYILTGSLAGQLVVSAPEDAKVQLVLKGASISPATGGRPS